ncbi:MAG TPA: hypothetical protein VLM05_22380 [Mycobacteriales bacterium]|nr:hypothetical protein [Mycobacteriales bacterium]
MSATELADADSRARTPTARRLLLVWQDPDTRAFVPVGALTAEPDDSFTFRYLRRAERHDSFRPLASFPRLREIYRFVDLPPFFGNRVMSPRRPDYPDHLRALSLTEDTATPFEMLARTGGARATDTFHVVAEPAVEADGLVRTRFLAHGVRHIDGAGQRIERLSSGDRLRLRPDTANAVNPQALLVDAVAGEPVGWVPDWMLDTVRRLTAADPSYDLTVDVANGPAAPAHLRLLCLLTARVGTNGLLPRDPDLDYIAGA